MDDETFESDAEVLRSTAKALLVRLETGEEVWVPKSVIHADSEVWEDEHVGQQGKLVVLAGWAAKKGLA